MLLSVQVGYDAHTPLSLSENPAVFAEPLKRDFNGARIGWLGDLGGYLPFEAGVLDLCVRALPTFEMVGCKVFQRYSFRLNISGFLDARTMKGMKYASTVEAQTACPFDILS
jgi:Asp-tRNA(Asn)/Glu-tRNA(Gln) amidotransferase A subunit family amidase